GQGPIALAARVVYSLDAAAAREAGERPGFGVGFVLAPHERDLFDSFIIAVRRDVPWPDKSGRRHERFPIQLRAVYEYNGEQRREYTENLSRGGMFIDTFDPPAEGAVLSLELFA